MKRLTMEYEDKRVSLLPCPFCGSDPVIRSHKRYGSWYNIRCGNEREVCRMTPRTTDCRDLEQAAADWNMRPLEPNDPLTLDELREMDGKAVWNETMQKWVLVDYYWECGPRTVDAQGRWRDLDDCYYRRRPEEGMK